MASTDNVTQGYSRVILQLNQRPGGRPPSTASVAVFENSAYDSISSIFDKRWHVKNVDREVEFFDKRDNSITVKDLQAVVNNAIHGGQGK